jgi:hypothetical protein
LVENVIKQQCHNGKNIRGKTVTEITVEELSEAIADVMLRVFLYAGWRDLLNIKGPLLTLFNLVLCMERTNTDRQERRKRQTICRLSGQDWDNLGGLLVKPVLDIIGN